MSSTFYEYPLQIRGTQTVKMPIGASVLSVQQQGMTPDGPVLVLWAIVDVDVKVVEHEVRIFGTGHEVRGIRDPDRRFTYVDTVVCSDDFVWHIFVDTHHCMVERTR